MATISTLNDVVTVILSTLLCWACSLGAGGRITGMISTIIMLVPTPARPRLGAVMLGAVATLLVTTPLDGVTPALGSSQPE